MVEQCQSLARARVWSELGQSWVWGIWGAVTWAGPGLYGSMHGPNGACWAGTVLGAGPAQAGLLH